MIALPSADDLTTGVKTWLKLSNADDPVLALVVTTTRAFVASLPLAADVAGESADDTQLRTERIKLGAIMLASRLYRRRNSPSGVESQTEAGVTYVARHDSDVSRLLGLDQFARPQVG